jgi:malonyl-CoA O-methyltransferase
MDHKKIIKKRYDETVNHYDRRYEKIQAYKYELAFKRIFIKPDHLILDIGCGTGNLFGFLETNHCFMCGIDFSIESLKRIRDKLGRNRITHLGCADSENLPFKKNSFDIVFAFTVLQNLPDPKASLKEIYRICKPDGLIVLSLLRKKFPPERIEELVEEIKGVPKDMINDPECEDIIVLLENS